MKKNIIVLILILLTILSLSTIELKAASREEMIQKYIVPDVPNGYSIIYPGETDTLIIYHINGGKITGREPFKTFLDSVKSAKYSLFIKSQGDETNPFSNTGITADNFKSGTFLEGSNIYSEGSKISSLNRQDTTGELEIFLETKTIKIYIPAYAFAYTPISAATGQTGAVKSYTEYISKGNSKNSKYNLSDETIIKYTYEFNMCLYTNNGLKEIKKAVQEGIVAGSIETGYNVGSVYSETQQPLNDIMEEIKDESGTFYKFKDNVSIKAGLDYFYSPVFGRMPIKDGVPKTDEEWNTKAHTLDISKGYIDIDSGYKKFVSPNSPEREGIFEVNSNLTFTNGVVGYKQGVSSKEPKKLVNYNLSIGLPNQFNKIIGKGTYALDKLGLHVLKDLRMSVNNDNIYDFSGDEKKQVCSNKDIDLQRDYIALYYQLVEGNPLGVVVVLKYSEVVIDNRPVSTNSVLTQDGVSNETTGTTDVSNKMFLTGRKVVLNNSYSNRLVIDEENRDTMSIDTKIHGKMGIIPRKFVFPTEGKPTLEYMIDKDNHRVIETDEHMSLLINFIGTSINGDTSEKDSILGFYIARNNTYIQDGELLSWLSTPEARAIDEVRAEELEELINGVFKIKDITFFDWLRMKDIEDNLSIYKNNFMYRVINVFLIVVGTFMIVLGVLFIFAYWFDVFNSFSEFSILYYISFRRIYPILNQDMIPHMSGDRKYVTFKNVMLISCILWILGVTFLENNIVITLIVNIYLYITNTIGGF